MVNSMTLIPAIDTPAFGMPVCGHPSFRGGITAPIAVAKLSQGDVSTFAGANGAGERDYAARWGSSSWSPPSR